MRLATYASISVALILIVGKLIAWGLSDSISLLATLIDSVLDALASLINLIAVRHALTPADKEHRFGHGKAEALAGLSQSMFIAGSAGFLLLEAGRRIVDPVSDSICQHKYCCNGIFDSCNTAVSVISKLRNPKTQSTAIRADALHYKSDLVINASVILALWLSMRGLPQFDAPIGMLIAVYILYSAWEIIRVSYDQLMDRELPDQERSKIKQIVLKHPKANGLHDLRTRSSGTVTFIQLHLELDDDLSLLQAHNISDEVEESLLLEYPGAEIIIHIDPQSVLGHEAMAKFN